MPERGYSCASSSRCRGRPARLEPRGDGHRRGDPGHRWSEHTCSLPAVEPRGSAPAELFLVDGGPATVGIIASVTRPFCGACDRVRLTADGQVRNCLFAREESDLRTALRAGASDEELAERWVVAMAGKKPGPRDRRPEVPPAGPADVGDRRLAVIVGSGGPDALVGALDVLDDVLEEAARAQEVRERARCSSQASQTLRRSGVCSLGLFQRSAQTAGCWRPLAEQMSLTRQCLVTGPERKWCRPTTGRAVRHHTEPDGVRSAFKVFHAAARNQTSPRQAEMSAGLAARAELRMSSALVDQARNRRPSCRRHWPSRRRHKAAPAPPRSGSARASGARPARRRWLRRSRRCAAPSRGGTASAATRCRAFRLDAAEVMRTASGSR